MKTLSQYKVALTLGLLASSGLLAQTYSSGVSNRAGNDVNASSPSSTAPANTTVFAPQNDLLVSKIQSADYSSRSDLTSNVEQSIDSQKSQLKTVKREGRHLDGQAKSDFKSAWEDVEAREKDLKHSLRDARNASATDWDAARTKLAADYQAFESAVSRAQLQASGNTLNSSTWSTAPSANATYSGTAQSTNDGSSNVQRMNSTATDSSGATTGGDNSQADSSTATSRNNR